MRNEGLVGDHVGVSSARQRSYRIWLRAVSGYACARDYGRCSRPRVLSHLQLLEPIRELRERLGERVRQGRRRWRCLGARRAPWIVVLVFDAIPAGVFRVHLLRIALCIGELPEPLVQVSGLSITE